MPIHLIQIIESSGFDKIHRVGTIPVGRWVGGLLPDVLSTQDSSLPTMQGALLFRCSVHRYSSSI